MRFGSLVEALAKCKLQCYRISEWTGEQLQRKRLEHTLEASIGSDQEL